MNIVIGQFRHGFHDYGKLLHAWNILDNVKFRPSDSDVPEEMKEQIVSGPHPMNVTNGRVFSARISSHHYMTLLLIVN